MRIPGHPWRAHTIQVLESSEARVAAAAARAAAGTRSRRITGPTTARTGIARAASTAGPGGIAGATAAARAGVARAATTARTGGITRPAATGTRVTGSAAAGAGIARTTATARAR